MNGDINPRVVGATIIGFALIFGAYTISNFGESRKPIVVAEQPSSINPLRVPIAVADEDGNGIEDWRDEFVTTEPIFIDKKVEDYTPPDTLTGQMSLDFVEDYVRAKGYGPFGKTPEEIIDKTNAYLIQETELEKIYDTPDIVVIENWDDDDLVNYANTVAATIRRHNQEGLQSELVILHDVITNGNRERMSEIITLAEVYESYRDDTLKIPVPLSLVKNHLDLINSYNAVYTDLKSMTIYKDDPARTLLRLKRYQDDANGLYLSLQNMYLALEPYSSLFTIEDPAIIFVGFSPGYQI